MSKCRKLEEPMNAGERYLYAIAERLDVLIDFLERIVPTPKEDFKTEVILDKPVVNEAPVIPNQTKKVNNRKRAPKG